jgi:glycosyltransferase involved in cell wall biosynthesis
VSKKVLIITYLPFASPRITGLADYLTGFGWEPVVLTPPLPEKQETGYRVVETDYREFFGFLGKRLGFSEGSEDDVHRNLEKRFGGKWQRLLNSLLTCGGALVNYPDIKRGWRPFAVTAGSELLAKEDFHAILSSSLPVTAHLVAAELKTKYNLPWLADLRDLWSQNHNYTYGPLRRLVDRRLEKKVLSGAEMLTTVSPPWAEELATLHPKQKVRTVPNGFDPLLKKKETSELTPEFSITYTGRVYPGKQDISRFFTALSELIAEGRIDPTDVVVDIYGPVMAWLDAEVKTCGLADIVRCRGIVPREEVAERQRRSQLLLLLDWEDKNESGVYPGKIYEYLAAGRPILATGGHSGTVVHRLLEETAGGMHAVSKPDIRRALGVFYDEYRQQRQIKFHGRSRVIDNYSYRAMAERFAGLLDDIT